MANTSELRTGGSLSARAAMTLRDMIINGAMRPEQRYTETQLAEILSMSRTPIRAALQRMTDEGLLIAQPGGGYTIRQLTPQEIEDTIEVRGLLEGHAARLLAERGISGEVLAELGEILSAIDRLLDDDGFAAAQLTTYERLNARFHQRIAEATANAVLIQEIGRANGRPFASASALVGTYASDQAARRHLLVGQDQHHALIDAIRNRQGTRAEAIMREHARLALRNLTRALGQSRLPDRIAGSGLIRRPVEETG